MTIINSFETLNYPWCHNSQFILVNEINMFYQCEFCKSAGSTLSSKGNQETLYWYLIYYQNYTLYFYLDLNIFMFYCNGERKMELNYLPNITQSNIKNKINLLLTFQ
jgi:hypothetical protein